MVDDDNLLITDVYIKPVPVALGGDVNKPVLISRPPPARAEIAVWERENGPLPDDYVAFLMAHNGGTVYPMAFLHNAVDRNGFLEIGPQTSVDTLFTWDTFIDTNNDAFSDWRKENVAIGDDTTSSLIIISRRPQDHGAVKYWWRNISDWDEDQDGPIPVGTIAPGFRDFIFEALFVDPDGGNPRWYIPRDLATATKVSF